MTPIIRASDVATGEAFVANYTYRRQLLLRRQHVQPAYTTTCLVTEINVIQSLIILQYQQALLA